MYPYSKSSQKTSLYRSKYDSYHQPSHHTSFSNAKYSSHLKNNYLNRSLVGHSSSFSGAGLHSEHIPSDPNRANKLKNKNLNHPGYQKRPAHDVYEEDIQCVYSKYTSDRNKGNIYVGNLQAAQNLQTLQRLKIGGLLTACKGIHIKHPESEVPHYLYIPGDDHERYDLSVHFQTAIKFIKKVLQETNILVHCMAGVSRSVTLVIVYLLQQEGFKLEQALRDVKSRRKIINPNEGFIKQMRNFEKEIASKSHKRIVGNEENIQSKMMRMAHNRSYDGLLKDPSIVSSPHKHKEDLYNNTHSYHHPQGPLSTYFKDQQPKRPYFQEPSKQKQAVYGSSPSHKLSANQMKNTSYLEERQRLKRQLQSLKRMSTSNVRIGDVNESNAAQMRKTICLSTETSIKPAFNAQSTPNADFIDEGRWKMYGTLTKNHIGNNKTVTSAYLPEYAHEHKLYGSGSGNRMRDYNDLNQDLQQKISNIKKKYEQYSHELRDHKGSHYPSSTKKQYQNIDSYMPGNTKHHHSANMGSSMYQQSRVAENMRIYQGREDMGRPRSHMEGVLSSSPSSINQMGRDELRRRMAAVEQGYRAHHANNRQRQF